eukprot:3398415-Heterocapsa_arctica.AAC.1
MLPTLAVGYRAVQRRLSIDLACKRIVFDAWEKCLVKASTTCPLGSCHMPEIWAVPVDYRGIALGVVFPHV